MKVWLAIYLETGNGVIIFLKIHILKFYFFEQLFGKLFLVLAIFARFSVQ